MTGPDPFTTDVNVTGDITHGHLPENDNHGGGRFAGLPDARDLLALPVRGNGGAVRVSGFVYGQGDLSGTGKRGKPARSSAASGSRSSTATRGRG